MKRFALEPRRLIGVSVATSLLGLLMALLYSDTVGLSSPTLHMYAFYFELNPAKTVSALIMLIPSCIIAAILSDVLTRDYDIVSTYCFCRFKSVQAWYCLKNLSIIIYSFCSALCYSAVNFITIVFIYKESAQLSKDALCAVLSAFALLFLFLSTLTLIINTVSLRLSSKWAFLAQLSVLFLSLASLKTTDPPLLLVKLNPVVNYMLTCHSEAVPYLENSAGLLSIKNMSVGFSVMYFVAITLTVYVVGAIFIKKTDLGLRED